MFLRVALSVGVALLATVGSSFVSSSEPLSVNTDLEAGFRHPPDAARPAAYWLWLNGYVNRPHVERELQAYHDAGVRGLCIFDMGAQGAAETLPPAGPAFMSDQSVADIAHAVRVAERIGMDVQLSVASSWDMGGSWVEPRHASMGLLQSEIQVDGPATIDEILPFPPIPAKTPRREDGSPIFYQDVAVLAIPAERRLPGYDFVFKLERNNQAPLNHAVLHNAPSDDSKEYGERHLFTKDISVAVSTTTPSDDAFREVLRASLKPTVGPQRFDLPPVHARYVRLRILSGHNRPSDRVQLGEFELFDSEGVNVIGSHVADRNRDGAELIGYPPALGHDKSWTAGNLHDGSTVGPGGCWCLARAAAAVDRGSLENRRPDGSGRRGRTASVERPARQMGDRTIRLHEHGRTVEGPQSELERLGDRSFQPRGDPHLPERFDRAASIEARPTRSDGFEATLPGQLRGPRRRSGRRTCSSSSAAIAATT